MKRALALLLLLGACVSDGRAPRGAGAPLLAEAENVESIALAGQTAAMSRWAPPVSWSGAPKAMILALHGFGDYGLSTFERPAAYWAERGFLTYAYDQRGFGRNASRGDWPGADGLIADVSAVAAMLRARHPALPLFLVGHSMGGGAALAAVGEGLDVDGLVLAAPAVWGGDALAPPYRVAAWVGAAILPDKRWSGDGVVSIQASDNIPALIALGRDPLYLGQPSSREFLGLIRVMDRAVAAAPQVRAPTLTLYGANDEVAPRGAVMAAHEALGGPKALRFYPEGWHLLFRDLQARRVWADVTDWMGARS